ncbi:hypothetical protein TNCV_5135451 [Trichonephila clavipes]|nr:hypothetical protein TNCV_5135451 [Trichonephila clavipes]
MSSFLVLSDRDTRNRWRDGQVCPDVGQGTMAPWTRRPGRERKETGEREKRGKRKKERREETEKEREGDGKREEKEPGEREREVPALYGEKG